MRRTPSSPGFDPRIADWLEDDPDHAPRAVLDTVLAAVPSIRQRHAWRLPRRFQTMNRFALLGAVAVLTAAVALGGLVLVSRSPGPKVGASPDPLPSGGPPASALVTPVPLATPSPSASLPSLGGQILLEHFGSAPDGSEGSSVGADVHRLYLADPNNMTATGMVELLPGQPATGKLSADVSPDALRVVFEDWADPSSIYLVNIDGTGFRKITPDGCGCSEWDPAFDPTGRRIVYGHASGGRAWLEIRDLTTGTTTKLTTTEGPADDAVPEAPSWSPDGSRIVFARLTWNGVAASMGRVHYHTGLPAADELSVVDLAKGEVVDIPTPGLFPGDPDWSPDGTLILFTNGPLTIFDDDSVTHDVYTIHPDGTSLARVESVVGTRRYTLQGDSANWTPDGRILSTFNFFTLWEPDGSGGRRVDPNGMDNTESNVGYVYVGHWVGTP